MNGLSGAAINEAMTGMGDGLNAAGYADYFPDGAESAANGVNNDYFGESYQVLHDINSILNNVSSVSSVVTGDKVHNAKVNVKPSLSALNALIEKGKASLERSNGQMDYRV